MKNNGFTLIELLGVIIILALLVILVFPSIINSVKNSSKKTDDLTLELIYNATELFISNHSNDFPKTNGNKFTILLTDLVAEDFLVSPIKLSESDKDLTDSKCVQVTYNNGYKYELKDTCVFDIKCSLKDNDNDEKASLSDEVTCGTESFYVMSNDGTNITMLAMYNLNVGDYAYEGGTLGIQNENVRGSNTDYAPYGTVAFSTTDYWSATTPISTNHLYVYGDYPNENNEQQNIIYPYVEAYETYLRDTLKVSSASATLMSYDEAEDLDTKLGVSSWLYATSYWLGTAYYYYQEDLGTSAEWRATDMVYTVNASGDINSLEFYISNEDMEGTPAFGIRPVVTLPLESVSIMK